MLNTSDMTAEELHRREVIRRIEGAFARGASSLYEILPNCEGADPAFVATCVAELGGTATAIPMRSPATYGSELLAMLMR